MAKWCLRLFAPHSYSMQFQPGLFCRCEQGMVILCMSSCTPICLKLRHRNEMKALRHSAFPRCLKTIMCLHVLSRLAQPLYQYVNSQHYLIQGIFAQSWTLSLSKSLAWIKPFVKEFSCGIVELWISWLDYAMRYFFYLKGQNRHYWLKHTLINGGIFAQKLAIVIQTQSLHFTIPHSRLYEWFHSKLMQSVCPI